MQAYDFLKKHILALTLVLMAAVFIIDINTPLGYADWILYLLPIVLISYSGGMSIYIIASACTILIAIGFVLSPPGSLPLPNAAINRLLAIVVFWLIAVSAVRRRLAEDSARIANLYNRSLIEASIDPLVTIGQDGKITDVNKATENITGFKRTELIGTDFSGYFTDPEKARQGYKQVYERGFVNNYALDVRNRDGRTTSVLYNASVFRDESGNIAGVFAAARDITKQKEIENELRENQSRLDLALRSAHMGVWHLDIIGSKRYFDEQVCNLLGIDSTTFKGSPEEFFRVVHPDDQEMLKTALSRTIEQDMPYEPEYRVVWQNGSIHYIAARGRLVRDDNGRPLRINGIIWDITERKRSEEALIEGQRKLDLFLNSAAEGIYGIDMDGNCTFCNKSGLAMLGYDNEQALLGKNIHELVHHTKADGSHYPIEECLARKVLAAGSHLHSDKEVLFRSDGSSFPAEYWAYPIMKEDNIAGAVVTFVDISNRINLENQLRQAQKMEAVGTLAGGIAHDFNNILSAVLGYANLVEMKLRPDDLARNDIEEILEAVKRASALTQSLLAYSRKQSVLFETVNLNDLVKGVERFLRRLIREDIELKLNCENDELLITADRIQLEQVLMNLVTNARDAMPDGGRLGIETKRTYMDSTFADVHGYGTPGEYALLTVTDTGIGMDEKIREKIFDPFFTTKEHGRGTGLGLSMAYGTVKQHKGYINVYSEPDKGTTFRIYLPIATERKEGAVEEAKAAVTIEGGTETVLVAEDDAALRKLAKTVLEHYGYRVIEAVDGQDAVEKFMENKDSIDLVILDGIMPRKSGKETYKDIRAIRNEISVVFMSGYTEDIFAKEGLAGEYAAFLPKPISPLDLVKRIREILDAGKRHG